MRSEDKTMNDNPGSATNREYIEYCAWVDQKYPGCRMDADEWMEYRNAEERAHEMPYSIIRD